jgi:hypothetical protein
VLEHLDPLPHMRPWPGPIDGKPALRRPLNLSAAIASRAALSIEQMPETEPLSDVEGECARRFAALPHRER